ncbi:MAG: hypothetical protein HY046_12980, partial [Acidobacteria bacterium]|nr:hypothetical protein [Acidobacteriota bacterium]
MVEKPQDELEAQKRRSTRIVQAVPITVIGVDALGQPFREHTSTLIINCHGCKYQSKHYVLKNTQVTIEVAHPEGGPPRQVRARILWIQRPRTVQELFQVGAEMDVAGNIWGIAFPPEDWAPAPDSGAPSIPAPAPKTPVQQAAPPVAAPPVPTPPAVVGRSTARGGLPAEPHGPVAGLPAAPTEPPVATPPAPPVEDKVRQMPRLGIEAEYSATLTKQMGRLLEDAKQQIQSAAKNAASEAVAAETGQLLRDLNAQLQQAAQQVIEKVAADAAHQMAERARAEFETLRESGNEVSREKWSAETERLVQQSMQDLNLRLTESGEVVRKQFAEQVEAGAAHAKRQLDEIELRIAALRGVIGNAADAATLRIENMRAEMDATAEAREHHWNERLEQQAVEGIVRLGVLEHEARGLNDRIGAIAGDALKTWHGKLDEELAANDAKWAAAIETAMQTATEKLQQRILDMTSAAELKAETDLSGRMGSLRQALEETTATLRESLTQTTAEAQKRAEELRAELAKLTAELAALQGENPLIGVTVDAQIVGEVISGWTGIPVGKMVKDEIQTILELPEVLGSRVIGQRH